MVDGIKGFIDKNASDITQETEKYDVQWQLTQR